MLSLSECVWDLQNNALWDTHWNALFATDTKLQIQVRVSSGYATDKTPMTEKPLTFEEHFFIAIWAIPFWHCCLFQRLRVSQIHGFHTYQLWHSNAWPYLVKQFCQMNAQHRYIAKLSNIQTVHILSRPNLLHLQIQMKTNGWNITRNFGSNDTEIMAQDSSLVWVT